LRFILIAIAMVCLVVQPAAAQTEDGCLEEAAHSLTKNQLITVIAQDSSVTSGLLQAVDLGRNFLTLDVRVGGDQSAGFRTVNFQLADIDKITAQEGKGIGKQAWIGALIGAAVGVVAGAALGDSEPGAYVPGLLIGGAFGGWVGYELQPDPPPIIIDCE
jgi:hypothetical protein